jgi:hypothetical protein
VKGILVRFLTACGCLAEGGASSNQCSETYAGTGPFSAVETATLAETIENLNPTVYLSFHSYSQLLMVPFGHRYEKANNYYKLVRTCLLPVHRARQNCPLCSTSQPLCKI